MYSLSGQQPHTVSTEDSGTRDVEHWDQSLYDTLLCFINHVEAYFTKKTSETRVKVRPAFETS